MRRKLGGPWCHASCVHNPLSSCPLQLSARHPACRAGGASIAASWSASNLVFVQDSFCARTRAGTAHAHFLSTWYNANGKRGNSDFPLPGFKSNGMASQGPESRKRGFPALRKRIGNLFEACGCFCSNDSNKHTRFRHAALNAHASSTVGALKAHASSAVGAKNRKLQALYLTQQKN